MTEAESLYRKGTALLDCDPEGALLYLTQSLEREPDAPPAVYNRAVVYARLGRDAEAIADVIRLELLAPHLGKELRFDLMASAAPYTDIGNKEYEAGNYEIALCKYESALTYNSQYANAWIGKAIVLSKLGRSNQAFECYSKAAELEPDNYFVWINRAELHYKKGNLKDADYTRAIAILPSDPDAYLGRSAVFLIMGQSDKAMQDRELAAYLNNPEKD